MRIRAVILAAIGVFMTSDALAQVSVRGYTRKDGTRVRPHMRSSPNSTTSDNYSTKGNINPYTGEPGTRNPTPSAPRASTTRLRYGSSTGTSRSRSSRSSGLGSLGGGGSYYSYSPSTIYGSNPQCSLSIGEMNAVAKGRELLVIGTGCKVHIKGN